MDIKEIKINCPKCGKNIILDSIPYWNYKGLVRCQGCKRTCSIEISGGRLTTTPELVYSLNPDFKSPPIPNYILEDFKEAIICYSNRAPKACIVMCGRSLEDLTNEQSASGNTLNEKIKNLHDNDVISDTLYNAFTKIRTLRNIGAHSSPTSIIQPGEDKKILDITKHVIEHVYVLPLLLD